MYMDVNKYEKVLLLLENYIIKWIDRKLGKHFPTIDTTSSTGFSSVFTFRNYS